MNQQVQGKTLPFVKREGDLADQHVDGIIPAGVAEMKEADFGCCTFRVDRHGRKPCLCARGIRPVGDAVTLICTFFGREITTYEALNCPHGPVECKLQT